MDNPQKIAEVYDFDGFRLDERGRGLTRGEEVIPLAPKDLRVLLALVSHPGEVLDKEFFRREVWEGNSVTDNSLSQSIKAVRRALGDSRSEPRYIETVTKRGYRFVAEVRKVEELSAAEPPAQGAAVSHSAPPEADGGVPAAVPPRPRVRPALIAIALILMASTVGLLVVRVRTGKAKAPPFQRLAVRRLTNGGTWVPAVSPDGRLLAYVANGTGVRESVWIRETGTGNAAQLVPADGAGYGSPVFSRSGDYLYYARIDLRSQSMNLFGDIYRIPVIGGTPYKVASEVSGNVSPSPDDNRLLFVRADPAAQEHKLIIVNADGTGEHVVSARKWPDIAWVPGWSPDGQLLAYCARNHEGDQFYNTVMAVPAGGGPERPLTSSRWMDVGWMIWLPDGSGLLLTGRERLGEPFQIYHVAYPSGEVRKVTQDANSYSALSITRDSKELVAEVAELTANIWVVPGGDAARAMQITHGGKDGVGGVAWTPDGRIVFATISRDSYNETGATGDRDIWVVDADGRNRRQLTFNEGINSNPAVTPDGRYIVFSSYRDGAWGVWRMNIDGGEQRQLAGGGTMTNPSCSPDGRWVVFRRLGPSRQPTLCRVSIEGGEVVEMTDKNAYPPSVSPDGKLISFFAAEEKSNELVLVPAGGGAPVKTFNVSPNFRFLYFTMITRWAGDSGPITYIDNIGEVSNIWGLNVTDGSTRRMTDFNTDSIFSFDWSRDGRQLVVTRGQYSRQIVRIEDSR